MYLGLQIWDVFVTNCKNRFFVDPISRIRERKILEVGRPVKRVTAQILWVVISQWEKKRERKWTVGIEVGEFKGRGPWEAVKDDFRIL